jgi:hypothetical protein
VIQSIVFRCVVLAIPRKALAGLDGATPDELLERIKAELVTLAPILDLEVTHEPEGSLRAPCPRTRPAGTANL